MRTPAECSYAAHRLRRLAVPLVLLLLVTSRVDVAAAQDSESLGLVFSTYLGGAGIELGQAIAIDDHGAVYVAGTTASDDFPVTSGISRRRGGIAGLDVYVAKLGPRGELHFATLLGGSGDDVVTSIAVDRQGRACVAGGTNSSDFPAITASLHPYRGGSVLDSDGFLACLSADGTEIEVATYLGGSGDDAINALVIDNDGRMFVAGTTASADFPATVSAVQSSFAGGIALQTDAFAARLRRVGESITADYITYFGGSFDEVGMGVAADDQGRLYVSGQTNSPDMPTRRPIQGTYGGPLRVLEGDGFLARIGPEGGELEFATFLGGSRNDQVTGVVVDREGSVRLAGWTQSLDFPVSAGVLQNARLGPVDAFVLKLVPDDSGPWTIGYSSYLGGSGIDQAFGLAVDPLGRVVIAGATTSGDLSLRDSFQGRSLVDFSDGFVARLSADGAGLSFASYMGGALAEGIHGVAAGSDGGFCVTGGTGSADFPLRAPLAVPAGSSLTNGAADNAFVACIGEGATGVRAEGESLDAPRRFALHPSYPNPFNPTATVQFDVRFQSHVRLAVYDVAGRLVATLVDGTYAPGRYTAVVDASGWASGVYLCRLEAEGFKQTQKMVLVR